MILNVSLKSKFHILTAGDKIPLPCARFCVFFFFNLYVLCTARFERQLTWRVESMYYICRFLSFIGVLTVLYVCKFLLVDKKKSFSECSFMTVCVGSLGYFQLIFIPNYLAEMLERKGCLGPFCSFRHLHNSQIVRLNLLYIFDEQTHRKMLKENRVSLPIRCFSI